MGRKSKIEAHPQSEEIIKRLASGEEYSDIIRDFPSLKWDDLDYYKQNKLPKLISKSDELKSMAGIEEAGQVAQANTLLEDIKALRLKATAILETAEQAGDLKTALLGIREARGCLELQARAEGQIREQPQINILINPQWVELRTLIITALEPFPEARQVVLDAIHE